MARPKKDGEFLHCFIDKELSKRLTQYAEEMGQTKTVAVERLLKEALDKKENKCSK